MSANKVLSSCPNWDKETWISERDYQNKAALWIIDFARLEKVHKIVDIGCGRGGIISSISNRINNSRPISAVDCSETIGRHEIDRAEDNVEYIKCSGLPWLKSIPDCSVDRVILKQVIHCFSPTERNLVLQETHRILTHSGKGLIMIMPPTAPFPLFGAAHNLFAESNVNYKDIILELGKIGFSVKSKVFEYDISLSRDKWMQMLRNRFMSSLVPMSDDEIEDGIAELDQQFGKDHTYCFKDQLIGILFEH